MNGWPLFLSSVRYAIDEGIDPIVSTDSSKIIDICKSMEIKYFKEKVDDSNMFNCIKQVIESLDKKPSMFALLQPTSPMRQKSLLRKMISEVPVDGSFHSCFTVQNLKCIGFLDGKFQVAYRDQDTSRRFFHFDGNILLCNTKWVMKNKKLFDDDSTIYENPFPYYLQIDTESEYNVMNMISKNLLF